MHIIQCSICRRAAAWMIDTEVFCEGHKEGIIRSLRHRSLSYPRAYRVRRGIPYGWPLLEEMQDETEEERW
jgi:hypothetical protein